MRIAFLGLGRMGDPMARRLVGAFELTVFNRDMARARPFEALGARVAGSVRDAVAGADLAVTMLADDGAEEAITFGAGGLPEALAPEATLKILNTTLLKSPLADAYGGAVVRGDFEPAGFALRLGLKDVSLALRAAEAYQAPLPIASLLRDRLLAAVAKGYGEQDLAALSRISREDAGL